MHGNMGQRLPERKVVGMLVEERNGRFYAVHPTADQNGEGKARAQEGECEVPEDMVPILRLDYVADYNLEHDSIKYSEDFYPDLFKELEAGKTDAEAYNSLGFDTGVLGRFRAANACKKAREKARLAKAREGMGQAPGEAAPELERYRSSPYVRHITENKIYYTEEFYLELSKRLEENMTPLEAYKDLGFDPGILGTQRAYKAAEHARDWKKRQLEGKVYKVGDFSGAVPLAKMMSEAGYPDNSSEWTARLMGRVIYLETILEELKKKR